MPVVRQGSFADSPRQTTMGPRPNSAPVCNTCRQRKQGQMYFRNPNGDFICEDCASPSDRRAMGVCDPDNCACGKHLEE